MKTIDFLPDIYRERMALRRARIWWGIVVLIFSTAIGSTAGAQYLLRRSVQQQFDDLASQYHASQQQVKLLAELQAKGRIAGQWAGLVVYLEQPWPRSQLVAEVVRPLPAAVRLTELIVVEEEIARPATAEAGPRRRPIRQEQEQSEKLDPAQADLEQLRRTHDFKRAVIEISGTVDDVALLHEYVTELGRSPLVARTQIKSLESAATTALEKPTNFTLRLVFKPGHGQPNPDEPQSSKATAGMPSQNLRVAQGGTTP
jgi:hypothetical protein